MNSIKKNLQSAIDEVVSSKINEAYVSEPKKFNLKTDFISEKIKKYRQEDFENYVKALNKVCSEIK